MGNERTEDHSAGRRAPPPRPPDTACEDALKAVAELARRLLACHAVAIATRNGARSVVAFDPAAPAPPGASHDPRTLADPLAADELGLEFYAGVPLIDARGRDLGTLAAVDRRVRELRAEQLEALKLAAQVAATLIAPDELRQS